MSRLSASRERAVWNGVGAILVALWFALLNGWKPLVLIISAAAVHECGHWLLLRLFHVPVTAFHITLFGAEMRTINSSLSYPAEIAAVLAGPGANLLFGAALLHLSGVCPFPFSAAAGAHFALALFNLLPVYPLDGGRLLELLLSWSISPDCGVRTAKIAGAASGAGAAAVLLWTVARTGGNLWLLPAAAGLAFFAVRPLREAGGKYQEEFRHVMEK